MNKGNNIQPFVNLADLPVKRRSTLKSESLIELGDRVKTDGLHRQAIENGLSPVYAALEANSYPKCGIESYWLDPILTESDEPSLESSARLVQHKNLLSELSWSISKSIQFPVNTIFAHGLGVVASAMSKSFKFKYGYKEKPVNLYVVTAQPPSTGKSGVNEILSDPVRYAFDAINKTAQANRKKVKIRISAIKQEMKSAKVKEQKYALSDELSELYEQHDKNIVYTYSATDPTPEGLSTLAVQQGGLFNIISAEADAINVILGNVYSDKKANHGMFLSGWDAERVTIVRSATKTLDFDAIGNIAVIAQDESIRAILTAGESGRGISERFLMLREKSFLGKRDHDLDIPINSALLRRYSDLIFNIVREEGVTLTFCQQSKQIINNYRKVLEPDMADNGRYSNNMMRGFVGKADKQIMKIASILHAIENWQNGGTRSTEIQSSTTDVALSIFKDIVNAYVCAADDLGFTGVESEYKKVESKLQDYASKGKLVVSVAQLRSSLKNVKPFANTNNLTAKLKEVLLPFLEESHICMTHNGKVYINPKLKD